MKNTLRLTSITALLLLVVGIVNAQMPSLCTAAPDVITVTQADGSTLKIVGRGNGIVSHTETADGYTVIKNAKGIYEYAVQGADGNLLPTAVKANDEQVRNRKELTFIASIEKHQSFSKYRIN